MRTTTIIVAVVAVYPLVRVPSLVRGNSPVLLRTRPRVPRTLSRDRSGPGVAIRQGTAPRRGHNCHCCRTNKRMPRALTECYSGTAGCCRAVLLQQYKVNPTHATCMRKPHRAPSDRPHPCQHSLEQVSASTRGSQ